MAPNPTLSLIVPTRQRTTKLRRLLESLAATAARPDDLEVVLVVDADDNESRDLCFQDLTIRRAVGPPGRPMGELNGDGYRASTGKWLMLLNDDVVARTPAWDEKVRDCLRAFPDDIALIHVNDTLLREALCTFPIVSRTFCEIAGGICPRAYARYRIDDHIEDVFNMLGVLGERRTVYLSDVVFQHLNFVENPEGRREYHSDGAVLAADAPRFKTFAPERKSLAIRLKEHIVDRDREREQRRWHSRLECLQDPFALRVLERLRVFSHEGKPSRGNSRATIGLLTPDTRGRSFRACLKAIERHSENYELAIVEGRDASSFCVARALNRVLQQAETDYVVFLEDNALVKPGWLADLFRGLTGNTALVSLSPPSSTRRLLPCFLSCLLEPASNEDQARAIMTACGSVLLIDTARCRRLFFDESYRSPACIADYGLQVWEQGYEVTGVPPRFVCSRDPGPRPLGSPPGLEVWEADRDLFAARWLRTGRLQSLASQTWARYPARLPFAGLDSKTQLDWARQSLEMVLDLEKRRPAWRPSFFAASMDGIKRACACIQRKGFHGLVRAVWKRIAAQKATFESRPVPSIQTGDSRLLIPDS